MFDHADDWLLKKFDAFVGWNRDRGRAGQWDLALASLDVSLLVLVAGAATSIHLQQRFNASTIMLMAMVPLYYGLITREQKIDIRRLRDRDNGALTARIKDANMRCWNLGTLLAIALVGGLSHYTVGDFSYMAAMMATNAAFYLKGALPPPPAPPKVETSLVPALQ